MSGRAGWPARPGRPERRGGKAQLQWDQARGPLMCRCCDEAIARRDAGGTVQLRARHGAQGRGRAVAEREAGPRTRRLTSLGWKAMLRSPASITWRTCRQHAVLRYERLPKNIACHMQAHAHVTACSASRGGV
jgi:hypothetical protein